MDPDPPRGSPCAMDHACPLVPKRIWDDARCRGFRLLGTQRGVSAAKPNILRAAQRPCRQLEAAQAQWRLQARPCCRGGLPAWAELPAYTRGRAVRIAPCTPWTGTASLSRRTSAATETYLGLTFMSFLCCCRCSVLLKAEITTVNHSQPIEPGR